MHPTRLDQNRADFMEQLYQRSGRTNQLFTGLWQEWCLKAGAELRDSLIKVEDD